MEIKRGERPVLIHVGRSSGATYETPLDAHPVEGGYVFFPNYGIESDWVRNVLAADSATLRLDGRELALIKPRLISEEQARARVADGTKVPGFLQGAEFLQMDVAG